MGDMSGVRGIKRNQIEDLTRIITDLKMVQRSVESYNKKYHSDLRIDGLDEITAYILEGIESIKNQPEVDPFSGLYTKGVKKS